MKKKQEILTQRFVIQNTLGLHARPAALFVQTANRFKSDIRVRKGRQKVNGKSIMGIMTLAAGIGAKITVYISGDDAKEAMDAIQDLFKTNFGEQEAGCEQEEKAEEASEQRQGPPEKGMS